MTLDLSGGAPTLAAYVCICVFDMLSPPRSLIGYGARFLDICLTTRSDLTVIFDLACMMHKKKYIFN